MDYLLNNPNISQKKEQELKSQKLKEAVQKTKENYFDNRVLITERMPYFSSILQVKNEKLNVHSKANQRYQVPPKPKRRPI